MRWRVAFCSILSDDGSAPLGYYTLAVTSIRIHDFLPLTASERRLLVPTAEVAQLLANRRPLNDLLKVPLIGTAITSGEHPLHHRKSRDFGRIRTSRGWRDVGDRRGAVRSSATGAAGTPCPRNSHLSSSVRS